LSLSIGPLHYTGVLPLTAAAVLVYAIAKSLRGGDASRELKAGLVLVVIGWLIYWVPFVTLDFTLREVFWNTSPGLPLWMRLASAWAGGGGSLFLFTLMVSISSLYILRGGRASRWLQAGLACIAVVGIAAAVLNDAFTVLPQKPASGAGLNPLLKSVWLYPHPLSTFSGYALLVVGVAALLAGEKRRGYAVFELGWALLTLGITIGGFWSYETFGWGGYWAWDPVEVSELMVWLAATLYPHLLVVARSLSSSVLGLVGSTVFLAMYVTRTGLSPLHSFAALDIGAIVLFITALSWLAYSLYSLYMHVDEGVRELLESVRSKQLYRVGLAVSAIALFVAALFVYAVLLVPSSMAALGREARVPQMEEGVRFYHPVLYPLMIVMLAAIPAAFIGDWLGWRGYFALVISTLIASTILGLAAYRGVLVLAHLSSLTTNIMMVFGLPWASIAAVSTITYIVLRSGKSLRRIARDRLAGLSLLHLGLAVTVIGVLLSGTFSFNAAYERSYTLRPGEAIELPGGFKIVFEDFEYGISSSKVDIYTNYVNRSTSYYYGQAALYMLAQDFAKLLQEYERGKKLVESNETARLILDLATSKPIPAEGTYTLEGRATIRYVDFAANTTLIVADNEPVKIVLTNVTIRPTLSQAQRGTRIFMPLQAANLTLVLHRNISAFLPAQMSIHSILSLEFSEPAKLDVGGLVLEVVNATLYSEQFLAGTRGNPLLVRGNIVTGKLAILDIYHGAVEVNGTKLSIPVEIPQSLITYYSVEHAPQYKRVIEAAKKTKLYDMLQYSDKVLRLAFTPSCLKIAQQDARLLSLHGCEAYVNAPRLVPETAWLDVVFRVVHGGKEDSIRARIRFEAYGEVQGIHGLVPKVIHPSRGLDDIYLVINPPVVDSFIYGGQVSYHELLIYYLSQAFKQLKPEERLALAAVMVGGYQADMLRNMPPQQALVMLEGSLIDVYLLANMFTKENSTIITKGLEVKVKIIPGVGLVWIGPVLMAASAVYLAALTLMARQRE
jgi:cytochrome c-type biogenesis protein CcmF